MTHDSLCPSPDCDYGKPDGECMCYEDCLHHCQCDVIAKARADEREQAAQRVVDLYLASHDMYSRPPVCAEVLNTIREEQP